MLSHFSYLHAATDFLRGVRVFSVVAFSWESSGFLAQVSTTDPGSLSSVFDLVVEKGLSLSLAILLIFGSFTQRISFDGRDERKRLAEREKEVDAKILAVDANLRAIDAKLNEIIGKLR